MAEYYIVFALTTAIFALIDIFMPVLREARDFGVLANMVNEQEEI